MTEPKDLLLIVEQLRRSKRRWKALALAALAACALLLLVAIFGAMWAQAQRMRAEGAARDAQAALANAHQARMEAQGAANPGQQR